MKLSQITNRKWNYIALAFAFPVIGILIVMLCSQCTPFGKSSILYSDMYHQYYPFFKEFRRILTSGGSVLYNWSVGLGMDYLGLYAYYLASPLNLLSVLIPESWLLSYFSLLVPIKLGLASMFFAIFLKKTFAENNISITLFGSFYGLCAWALGYQWNIMWLDTFALLPLVILSMTSLLKNGKFVLYTFTLFLSIFSNYYIGFFTCIFVFLTFFCYEICQWQGFKKFLHDLLLIALFSLLAIGMTAILELPALAALQKTQSSVNKFPKSFLLNMTDQENWRGLLQTMLKVAGNTNGGISPTFKEGLPNLYCGVFTSILSILYFFCPQIKLRNKLCALFLLLFFNISFIIRQLDYIWHGFHFTNMIPYRFSFLYSFVMLFMGYSAWRYRKTFALWQVILSAVTSVGILFCYEDLKDIVFWAYNGVLLLLYFTALFSQSIFHPTPSDATSEQRHALRKAHDTKKTICSNTLLGGLAVEIILNLINFGVSFTGTNISNYPKGTNDSAAALKYMTQLEADNPFYRIETTHTQTLNDGALNGYHGITTFTSSANVNVTEFMRTLGYGAKNTYNRYSFEESSPVTNLFLGLKYMLERDGNVEENPYFNDIYSRGKVHLLENNAYLPLGFLANSQLLNVEFRTDMDRFDFQNTLLRQATGLEENTWYILPGSALTINATGPTLNSQLHSGYCSYSTDSSTDGSITYNYTADRSGFMCVDLNLSQKNNITILLNGTELYKETYSLPQMLSIATVHPGDVVEIQLACKKNESGTITIDAAILDETVFRKGYNILSQSIYNITTFNDTRILGTIDCVHDGVMYTSIPQNGNWMTIVDGELVETALVGNVMIGVLLSEGKHSVEFIYQNNAFNLGSKISIACLILFTTLIYSIYKPKLRRKKGKYER